MARMNDFSAACISKPYSGIFSGGKRQEWQHLASHHHDGASADFLNLIHINWQYLAHQGQGYGKRLISEFHQQHRQNCQSQGQRNGKCSSLARSRPDVDRTVQFVDVGSDHIHANATT